jgi:hypothetical protein
MKFKTEYQQTEGGTELVVARENGDWYASAEDEKAVEKITVALNNHDGLVAAVKLAHQDLRPTKKIGTSEGFAQHIAWAALGRALHELQQYPGCDNCKAGTCGRKAS